VVVVVVEEEVVVGVEVSYVHAWMSPLWTKDRAHQKRTNAEVD
jgi:hypothetical protein